MKNKKDLKPLIILILIILLITLIYLYSKKDSNISSEEGEITLNGRNSSTTETEEAKVERRTITNTISTSGEIKTGLDEKLELHATYYFSEMYFLENDYVKEGENILKYTNGTYLKAPYNLVIKSISIPDKGSQCTNSHYIEVYSIDTLSISININEDELNKVSVGQEVSIIPTTYTTKTYTGYITQISNSGTYSSKGTTYSATVNFENDQNLKIGMSASADIILEKAENVLVVPIEAIKTQNEQKYVVVSENEKTQNTTVETGISNDAYIEIKSGLEEGEKIQITKSSSTNSKNLSNSNGEKTKK